MTHRPKIAFVWMNFTEYHVDRLRAAQDALPGYEVVGVELAAKTLHYDWGRPDFGRIRVDTLMPQPYETIPVWRRTWALLRWVLAERPQALICCHYEEIAVLCSALVMRLMGRLVATMIDSKWEDKPRHLWREGIKRLFLAPYHAALVGSRGTARYLEYFGFAPSRLFFGYDTVSVVRLRELAGDCAAGLAFGDRPIVVVSRLIGKKNLPGLLDAYALYRRRCGGAARRLEVLGSGPLEAMLRARIARDGIEGVSFHGFVTQRDLARHLSCALCLVLFSTVEQWGLAVNEAVALKIPVVVSDAVGARDFLVRTEINGAVVEPDNIDGLAAILLRLSCNPELWQAWRDGSQTFTASADTGGFAASVAAIIDCSGSIDTGPGGLR
ncbi:Glycosyl transferase [Candidatus Terasakiella magnetica]|nr:Glycosyl transferase [Candidatus Terasakiella magnetica]